MRYYYGTDDSYYRGKGRSVTVKQLASIIKRDVEFGKWNHYYGGRTNDITASCSYKRKGFVYHSRLFIYGKQDEFEELEKLITSFIEVTPRKFN